MKKSLIFIFLLVSFSVSVFSAPGDVYITRDNPTGESYSHFGNPAEIIGNKIFIALPYWDGSGSMWADVGKVIEFNADNGANIRSITNPNYADPSRVQDLFGMDLANFNGNLAIKSAFYSYTYQMRIGRIYIYNSDGSSLLGYIDPPYPADSGFGGITSFGDKLLIGGPSCDVLETVNSIEGKDPPPPEPVVSAGCIYIYDSAWNLIGQIDNPEPGENDYFGGPVLIIGDKLIIANPRDDVNDISDVGSIFVFDKNTLELLHRIDNPSPTANSFFGKTIANFNGNLAVGNYMYGEPFPQTGIVYVYDINTGEKIMNIENPDPYTLKPGDYFPSDGRDKFGVELHSLEENLVVYAEDVDPENKSLYAFGTDYIFNPDGELILAFSNPDPQTGDGFVPIAEYNGNLIVSADGKDTAYGMDVGEVYFVEGPGEVLPGNYLIQNVSVVATYLNRARIQWTTPELSDSRVIYGTASGIYTDEVYDSELVTNHDIILYGLNPNTKYYFLVESIGEQVGTSDEKTFRTISDVLVNRPNLIRKSPLLGNDNVFAFLVLVVIGFGYFVYKKLKK